MLYDMSCRKTSWAFWPLIRPRNEKMTVNPFEVNCNSCRAGLWLSAGRKDFEDCVHSGPFVQGCHPSQLCRPSISGCSWFSVHFLSIQVDTWWEWQRVCSFTSWLDPSCPSAHLEHCPWRFCRKHPSCDPKSWVKLHLKGYFMSKIS